MHFMNPVPLMSLVELIRGQATAPESMLMAAELCIRLNKTAVEASDYPGFIANRVLMPMVNEAYFAVMEGVGTADAIDTVMKLGMNHPMGPGRSPISSASTSAWRSWRSSTKVSDPSTGRARSCGMVAAGHLGRKSGQGFTGTDPVLPTNRRQGRDAADAGRSSRQRGVGLLSHRAVVAAGRNRSRRGAGAIPDTRDAGAASSSVWSSRPARSCCVMACSSRVAPNVRLAVGHTIAVAGFVLAAVPLMLISWCSGYWPARGSGRPSRSSQVAAPRAPRRLSAEPTSISASRVRRHP